MIRRVSALMLCLLLSFSQGWAASTIDGLPTGTFPFPDSGTPGTSKYNAWLSQNGLDVRATYEQLGYIFQGTVAPAAPFKYQLWWDTSLTVPALKSYDGSQWQVLGSLDSTNHVWAPPVGGGTATINVLATTDLGSAPEAAITINGAGAITSFGSTAPVGTIKFVTFNNAVTLTNNATSLILPGQRNILTANGDQVVAQSLGGGNWQIVMYQAIAPGGAVCAVANTQPANPTEGQCWIDSSAVFPIFKIYDGTAFVGVGSFDTSNHLYIGPVGGGTIASMVSASTTDLGSVPNASITITGNNSIVSFGSSATLGRIQFLNFTGTPTITYNASSMILPTAGNISVKVGDSMIAQYLGSGNWRVLVYQTNSPTSIATNAALKALAAGSAATVYRQGFYAAGDGGSATYNWNVANCSLNGGGGDNGSQVQPNIGNGCWLLDYSGKQITPQVFGAKGDGATNDRPALQAWINFGQTGFPNVELFIPAPTASYSLNDGTSLLISKAVNIHGAGMFWDTPTQQLVCQSSSGMPTLFWNSLTPAPVIQVKSTTQYNTLYGGRLGGFCVDGNNVATFGVQLTSTANWETDLAEFRVTTTGLELDDCNGNSATAAGLSASNYIRRNVYSAADPGHGSDPSNGVRLNASCTNTGVTNSHFGLLLSRVVNGDGFVNKGGDADQVDWTYNFVIQGGTGKGIAFRCFTSGSASVCGRTTQIHMGQGPVLAEANSYGNVIDFLHSEGTSVVLQGTVGVDQAQLQYHVVDNGNGAWFQSHPDYLMYDVATFPATIAKGAQFAGGLCSGVLSINAPSGQGTLTFSSTPGCITNGMAVADITLAANGATTGVANGTIVNGTTGTTVTLSANLIGNGMLAGDTVLFGTNPAQVGNDTASTFGATVLFPQNINSVATLNIADPVTWQMGTIIQINLYGYYDAACSSTETFQIDALGTTMSGGISPLGGDSFGFPQTITVSTSGVKNGGQILSFNLSPGIPAAYQYETFLRLTRKPAAVCANVNFFLTGLAVVFSGSGPTVNAVQPYNVSQPPWHH